VAQTGHEPDAWPLVIIKECIDNAADAAEEAGVAPVIHVTVARGRIRVRDNTTATAGRIGCSDTGSS
jgi:DNA topoisomerase VI subunit B